ncbi:class I SAM-dependent methyltransferase [Thiocystis violacea]|uniref:class I SAM-dependent methyltransferase n=1 Tax=Thiocystis violacea TaxID=13725 RepID=UPI0019078655|nr:class I SAM-dependent methyltransferase [Thiocystis violacea]MBK1718636.1 hypothetical protein [Thiocystis violacea]
MKEFYEDYYKEALSQCSGQGLDSRSFRLIARKYDWNYRKFFRLIPKEKAVLDYGCGIGQFLCYLHGKGFTNLTGIDISEQQITLAKSIQNHLNFEFTPNPDEWCLKHSERFDVIVINDVLEHILPYRTASFLTIIHNTLRPGGLLVIKTVNAAYPLGSAARYIDWTHTTAFTDRSLTQLLRHTGFKDIACYQEEIGIYSLLFLIKKLVVFITRGVLRLATYFSESDWPKIISVNIIVTAKKST